MPSKKQIEDQNEVVDEQRSLFAEIKNLIGEAVDELKNMENPLKGATDYFEQINESSKLSGDSEKARLGNTTFLELTFPNSGCRGAATLWLFRSETRVNFAFWLAHPTHPFPAVGCGSGSARAVDFSIFSVVLCTPQELFKR